MSGFVIPMPVDGHVHVRDDELLSRVLPYTTAHFGRALIMPNLVPPVVDAASMLAYRARIRERAPPEFEPLMTIYLTDKTTPELLFAARKAGAVAVKFYPRGATTNSTDGVKPEDFLAHHDWFEACQQAGLVVCIHAEVTHVAYPDREREFLRLFAQANLPKKFPKLRFVIEHVSTAAGVDFVRLYNNVAASVTLHHMELTYADTANPHHFCMPIPKTEKDRRAIVKAVLYDKRRRFFLGSDSAPHVLSRKVVPEGQEPKAGAYTAPVLLPKLAELFMMAHRFQRLQDFASLDFVNFYGLEPTERHIELVREPYVVPMPDPTPDALVPYYAGHPIGWNVRTR